MTEGYGKKFKGLQTRWVSYHFVRPLKFNPRFQKLVTKQASLQQIFRKCITSCISISLCYFLSLNGSNCSNLKAYFIKYVKYPLTAIKINGFFHPAFKRVLLDPWLCVSSWRVFSAYSKRGVKPTLERSLHSLYLQCCQLIILRTSFHNNQDA